MIFDAHTHIFPKEIRSNRKNYYNDQGFKLLYQTEGSRIASADELICYLDNSGIEAAFAFGFPWASMAPTRLCNDYVLASAKKYPGRIFPFACVNPFLGNEAVKEAERCLAQGAVGVGETAAYESGLNDELCRRIWPLADLCAETGAPLMLHVDEPIGRAHPGKGCSDLPELYALIKKFPKTKWILAHWGGGLLFYCLLKKEIDQVLKNVWFDTAAGPFLYKPKAYRAALDALLPERLIFGSDYPLLGIDRYITDMKSCGLSRSEKNAVLGENAAKLLSL